jgi:hypothetical protein
MNASQQVALFTAGFEHKHYEGATQEYEILDELNGQKGFFIKVFFINDKVNLNKWQVTWDGIKQDISDVVGVPIVKQDDLRHPNFAIQNLYAKGYIVDYVLNEEKHEASVIARILDAETIRLIREGELNFVSPAIVARNNLGLNNIDGVDVLSRFIALHLALVGEPAYGEVDAKIHGMCTGSGQSCGAKLKQMSATVMAELSHVGDCVSDKISILKKEKPDMAQDQIVAIAISMCKEKAAGKDTEKVIKREHDLLDKGIPEKDVHKMLVDEFGAENVPGSDSQNMDSLTQTPLLKRKLLASVNRLNSEVKMLQHNASKPEFEGHFGYWINAKDVDVFVADGVSVDAAMLSQCGCIKLADVKSTKEAADYQRTSSTNINCGSCKFYDAAAKTCSKVEGEIGEFFISKFYERSQN